jgi:hypothetical protein
MTSLPVGPIIASAFCLHCSIAITIPSLRGLSQHYNFEIYFLQIVETVVLAADRQLGMVVDS